MFRQTFYGQTISEYGRQYGRVDYRALAKSFDCVLCNGILGYRDSFDDWEQVHGFVDNSEELEELREELEAVEELIEETAEAKKEAEEALEELESTDGDFYDIHSKFDEFEDVANDLVEALKWSDFSTPNGEDMDYHTIVDAIECIDWWELRESIDDHQESIDREKDETEEAFEKAEKELEELTEKKAELDERIEELEEEENESAEVFQWYIVSDSGAQILTENTNEILYYNEELDLYLWGVTHWGTSWDYVLTSIPCETFEEEAEREEAEAKAEEERKAKAEAMTEAERAEQETEDLEELLNLWDSDEPTEAEAETEALKEAYDEAEAPRFEGVEEIPSDELMSEADLNALDSYLEELDIVSDDTEPNAELLEELEELEAETATPSDSEVEANNKPNEEAQLLRAWATLCRIEDAISEEAKRIREEDGAEYASECVRMAKHRFDIDDVVLYNGAWMVVTDSDRFGENLEIRDGDDHLIVNRWDVIGISSKGEEVSTPCSDEELEMLKANMAWC